MGKRLKICVVAATALLATLAAMPWLVPASAWHSQFEAEASKRLGIPLKINVLRWSVYPLPHLTLDALNLGGGLLTAKSIMIRPQLTSLLSERRVIRLIQLDGVVVSAMGVDWLIAQAVNPRDASGPGALTVEQIRANGLSIETAAGQLPELRAEIALDTTAALPVRQALVTTADGKSKLTLAPGAGVWQVALEAANWPFPIGPPLLFSKLKSTGQLTAQGLALSEVTASLYGGTLSGNVDLTWSKSWKLAGAVQLVSVDILPASEALRVKSLLSGRLDASGPFSTQAAKPAGLIEALNADIGFQVHNGVLNGFDFASAAKNLLTGGAGGGSTQFDECEGRLKVAGRAYKLAGVRVTSGLLKAEGNLEISATKQLSGRVVTEFKGTAGLVGVPLAVSGTLDQPVLRPTKGSMVGAAVGTVLLPGVGTTIGSTLGDKLGKLLGQ